MLADKKKRRPVMKAIVVTEQGAGIAGMKPVERP